MKSYIMPLRGPNLFCTLHPLPYVRLFLEQPLLYRPTCCYIQLSFRRACYTVPHCRCQAWNYLPKVTSRKLQRPIRDTCQARRHNSRWLWLLTHCNAGSAFSLSQKFGNFWAVVLTQRCTLFAFCAFSSFSRSSLLVLKGGQPNLREKRNQNAYHWKDARSHPDMNMGSAEEKGAGHIETPSFFDVHIGHLW